MEQINSLLAQNVLDIAIIVRKERLDNKKGEMKPLYVGKSSRQTY